MAPAAMKMREVSGRGRNFSWEFSPNAPGVHWLAAADLAEPGLPSVVPASGSERSIGQIPKYDEVDRRLMDTFPASDAVGRY